MKCFFFKEKSNSRKESKSASELQNERKKNNPALDRVCRSTSSLPSPRSVTELYKEKAKEQSFRVFTLQELVEATNDFNRMLKLGEGALGAFIKVQFGLTMDGVIQS